MNAKKNPKFTKENYTLDYSKDLVDRIEELQPMIIEVIDLKKKSRKPLKECARKVLANYPNIDIKFVGKTLDPDTGKKFETYKISKITEPTKSNSEAKKTPEIKTVEETKKRFYVGCIIGVRYVINTKSGRPFPERQTNLMCVWSDRDLANEPTAAEDLMVDGENKVRNSGFFLTEEDALANATFVAGKYLSMLAHELEYNDNPCRDCMRYAIKDVEELLKIARDFYHRHRELCLSDANMAGVKVFPDPDDMDDFKFVDGKVYLKNPPKDCTEHCLKVSGTGDLSKVIGESISKWLEERNKK